MRIRAVLSGCACAWLTVSDKTPLAWLARVSAAMPCKSPGLAALLGALAALGQAPWGMWPLTVLAFGLIMLLWCSTETGAKAAWLGWASGVGYFLLSLNWLVEPFLVDAAAHGWMAPFAVFFMAAGLSFFWALGFGIARRFGISIAVFIAGFIGAEFLRGWVFTGFPWAGLGHVLVDTNLLWLASGGGALALTGAVLVMSWGVTCLLLGAWIQAALVALLMGLGFFLAPLPLSGATEHVVRLVQPNAPQDEKWQGDKIPIFFERQLVLSAANPPADLVVWPETSLAYGVKDPLVRAEISLASKAPTIVGTQRHLEDGVFNSLVLLEEGRTTAVYDKHHLVPFGEYMPFGQVLSRFGIHGLAAKDGFGFTAGRAPELITIDGIGQALPLICYEGIFPRHLQTQERPDFIVLITNDAWFGKLSGPHQHLAQARLRSAEQGLPMVRVANTGISAVIDAHGQIVDQIALGKVGSLDVNLPSPALPTVFSKYGNAPLWGLLFLMVLIAQRKIILRKVKIKIDAMRAGP